MDSIQTELITQITEAVAEAEAETVLKMSKSQKNLSKSHKMFFKHLKINQRLEESLQEGKKIVEKLQNQIVLLKFFDKLRQSLLDTSENIKFLEDLANSNNTKGVVNEKLTRRLLREKAYQLIIKLKEKFDHLNLKYSLLTTKIDLCNKYRNQINIDLGYKKLILRDFYLTQDLCSGYGKQMEELSDRIQLQKWKFIRMPKGPLGTWITVQGEWIDQLEYIMKPYIFTFLVDNQQDAKLLNEFIDDIYGNMVSSRPPNDPSKRPCVWITKYDFPKLQVEKCKGRGASAYLDLVTLYDVIKIRGDDEVVKKFLMDFIKIEKTLLFKTQHEAFPVLSDRNSFPKGCVLSYTMDNYKVYPHPYFKSVQLHIEEGSSSSLADLFSCPNHLKFIFPPKNLVESKLKIFTQSREELDKILRAMKDIQLDLMEILVIIETKVAELKCGLKLLKEVPMNEIEQAMCSILHVNLGYLENSKKTLEQDKTGSPLSLDT